MRILFDASILKPGAAGISTFVRSLGTALLRIGDVYILTSVPNQFSGIDPARIIAIPESTQTFPQRQLWREMALRRHITGLGAEGLIVPAPEMPFRRISVPSIAVVFDVGPLARPDLYSVARNIRMRGLLRPVLRRSSRVVCISRFSQQELGRLLPGYEAKTEVVQCAVEPSRIQPLSEPVSNENVVLYIGTTHRHKNLETLVSSFASLPSLHLILVGPGTEKFRDASQNVTGKGWVELPELRILLSRATLLVNPSLYEGSGLPALEALASGIPTVLSDIPAFREVAGDAAAYVANPKSPDEWKAVLSEICSNPKRREELSLAGLRRVSQLSWDSVAQSYIDILGAVS